MHDIQRNCLPNESAPCLLAFDGRRRGLVDRSIATTLISTNICERRETDTFIHPRSEREPSDSFKSVLYITLLVPDDSNRAVR